jgi:hypothetical protein
MAAKRVPESKPEAKRAHDAARTAKHPAGARGAPANTPASKRTADAALQHALLAAAVKVHSGWLRFPRSAIETLSTTYAALLSLQRKKLIEPEKASDPAVMSWKVTKAGRAAIAE